MNTAPDAACYTMKLHLTSAENNNLITGCSNEHIEVNRKRYLTSLIVMPNSLELEWHPQTFSNICNAHFEQLAALKPEVVLLGTGQQHQFLHPQHYQALTKNGIALECMNTAAACRTYNILMSEGRFVAAALIL